MPKSALVNNSKDGLEFAGKIGFPVIIRPSFTLGGSGGGIAYNREEMVEVLTRGLDFSPVHEALIEESVLGWKEFELEVMRDTKDNVIIICSIENFDPMGVHTGDSITVAPAQTLTDREYQAMRDASIAVIREIGVDTGGSNIQFGVNPETGRMVVIEMNPRVSRSSALASKATGFPIAKIAAKLAVGYTLDEIPNDITRKTPACFEPTLDYVVVKIPKWQFEKFPGADDTLGPQMKSVGEVMAIGRTFKEALMKGIRSLDTGKTRWRREDRTEDSDQATGNAASGATGIRAVRAAPGTHGQADRQDDFDGPVVPVSAQGDQRPATGTGKASDGVDPDGSAAGIEAHGILRRSAGGRSGDWMGRKKSGICARSMASCRFTNASIPARRNSRASRPISIRLTKTRTRRRRLTKRKSSFSAAARTASGRELSSTTAAVMRRSRCATTGTRRS